MMTVPVVFAPSVTYKTFQWTWQSHPYQLHNSRHSGGPDIPTLWSKRVWCATLIFCNISHRGAGSAYGSLFGPGIYLAESCVSAEVGTGSESYRTVMETLVRSSEMYYSASTSPDMRGCFPLLLC